MRKKTLQCWEEHERCQKDGTLLDTVYESESEVTQSCPTLCDPMDYSLSGSSIHEIFQARVLEWIAISFSRGSSWPRNRTRVSCIAGRRFTVQLLSHVQIFATPWTAAHQAPLSFTVSWSLLKLMSIESVMPSNHLILCHPLLLLPSIFPSIRVFSSELALCIRWSKMEIQHQHQSFQWIFRVDFLQYLLIWSPCSLRDSQKAVQKH